MLFSLFWILVGAVLIVGLAREMSGWYVVLVINSILLAVLSMYFMIPDWLYYALIVLGMFLMRGFAKRIAAWVKDTIG